MMINLKQWFRSGTPWVWLNAGAVSTSILMVVALLILIASRGLGHFWAKPIMEADYVEADGNVIRLIGEIHDSEFVPAARLREGGIDLPKEIDTVRRLLVKTGNRDTGGLDFRWALEPQIRDRRYPEKLIALERYEWGNFYGYLKDVSVEGKVIASGEEAWNALQPLIERTNSPVSYTHLTLPTNREV